jgi:membrane protease YdiL (CAAX protease family)
MTPGIKPNGELLARKLMQFDQAFGPYNQRPKPSLGRGLVWSGFMVLMMFVSAFAYLIGYGAYLTFVQDINGTLLDVDALSAVAEIHIESVDALFGLLGMQILFVLPPLMFAAHFKGQSWRQTLAVKSFSGYAFCIAFGMFLAYLVLSFLVDILWVTELDGFIMQLVSSKNVWASVALVLFAPLVEEFFFRGYLFAVLRPTRLGASGTILITSLLFTLAHVGQYQWSVLLMLGVLALLLGYVREQSGSIWLPVLVHALNNLLTVVFVIWLGIV